MIQGILKSRALPDVTGMRREDLIRVLAENEYGYNPEGEISAHARLTDERDALDGRATISEYDLTAGIGRETCSFPYSLLLPKAGRPCPVFLVIGWGRDILASCPAEEIVSRGFGVAQFRAADVVNDKGHGDFSDGPGVWFHGQRDETAWGKIGMWAFAASRVADCLLRHPGVDGSRLSVIGHSRLGKTALWCGALDERFACVIGNESGAGGAALYRGKTGEKVSDFVNPTGSGLWDWFCGKMKQYYRKDGEAPFDQHMLLRLIAPRLLLIGCAEEDVWGDPHSEYLACVAAGSAWEEMGKTGFVAPDRMPEAGDNFPEGNICYHLRRGTHALLPLDWQCYLDAVEKHLM